MEQIHEPTEENDLDEFNLNSTSLNNSKHSSLLRVCDSSIYANCEYHDEKITRSHKRVILATKMLFWLQFMMFLAEQLNSWKSIKVFIINLLLLVQMFWKKSSGAI